MQKTIINKQNNMAFKLKAGNTGNPMHKNFPSSFPTRKVKLKGNHDEKVRRSKQPKGTTYDETDDSSNAPTSPMDKRTKTLGTRDDNMTMDNISKKDAINTLTTRNRKGEKVRTRDITDKRAARIKKRQARKIDKKMRPDAEADVATAAADVAAGPSGNLADQKKNQTDRLNRDFPENALKEGGPTLAELKARWAITDEVDKDVEPMKGQELADYKAKLEAELRAETAAEKK